MWFFSFFDLINVQNKLIREKNKAIREHTYKNINHSLIPKNTDKSNSKNARNYLFYYFYFLRGNKKNCIHTRKALQIQGVSQKGKHSTQ